MKIKITPEQYFSLQRENAELKAQLAAVQDDMAEMRSQLNWLKNQLFGQKSEKTEYVLPVSEQVHLFEDVAPHTEPETVTVREHTKRAKRTHDEIFADMPRDIVDIPAEKICEQCGSEMEHVSWEHARYELTMTPAKYKLTEYREEVVKCPRCGVEKEKNDDLSIAKSVFHRGKAPAAFIPGSYCSRELLAYIINEKFGKAVPLYRLEGEFKAKNIPLTRTTMGNWFKYVIENFFVHIYTVMKEELLKLPVINADETVTQVLHEPGRKATTDSRMWVYAGETPDGKNIFLFQYAPTRNGDNAVNFLGDYSGYYVCDGYDAYNKLKKAIRCGCWAHVRRKFVDALRNKPKVKEDPNAAPPPDNREPESASEKAIWYINKLFALEHIYNGEEPEYHENGKFRRWIKVREPLTPEQKKEERQRRSKPVLEEFYTWLETVPAAAKSVLDEAIRYALNEKPYLTRFLEDGNIPLSNNRAESAIRPFTVGRKNWLFSATPEGAKISAVIYSIVTTAKANGLDAEEYLEKIFSRPGAMIMPW